MSPSLKSVFAQLQRQSRLVRGSSRNFSSTTRNNNASNGGGGGAVQDRGPMVTLCKFRFSSSVVLGYFVGAGFEIMELSKTSRRLYEKKSPSWKNLRSNWSRICIRRFFMDPRINEFRRKALCLVS
ncbi:PREDICTED: uncharacterized protein LOC104744320 [Camelina sativa]|uniref:Uncharacterized protein LOC104744320 n=1 Tax=Camelina sativa TaxID=90675 RepID=A0ABM0VZM3_CAMSA|nr:PREDICTED: uncharacterized protein LOC104744320 [Camelina sativa]